MLYQRALVLREQHLSPDHFLTAFPLNGLAELSHAQGKGAEAELLFQRALYIREQQLGPDHPNVAMTLSGLANLYWVQGNVEQAKHLFQRALAINTIVYGAQHTLTQKMQESVKSLLQTRELKENTTQPEAMDRGGDNLSSRP